MVRSIKNFKIEKKTEVKKDPDVPWGLKVLKSYLIKDCSDVIEIDKYKCQVLQIYGVFFRFIILKPKFLYFKTEIFKYTFGCLKKS